MTTSLYAATAGHSSDPLLSGFSSLGRRSFEAVESLEAVECPECGKRTIVKRSHNTFDCLNCDFHRALPPVPSRTSQGSIQAVTPLSHRRYRRTPNSEPFSPLLTVDPNYQPLDIADEVSESSKMEPLLFAAIAVIFGILFL